MSLFAWKWIRWYIVITCTGNFKSTYSTEIMFILPDFFNLWLFDLNWIKRDYLDTLLRIIQIAVNIYSTVDTHATQRCPGSPRPLNLSNMNAVNLIAVHKVHRAWQQCSLTSTLYITHTSLYYNFLFCCYESLCLTSAWWDCLCGASNCYDDIVLLSLTPVIFPLLHLARF